MSITTTDWSLTDISTGRARLSTWSINLRNFSVSTVADVRGVATGVYGIYTPKSVQVNFLWGKNDNRTATEHEYWILYLPKKFYTPKQISGYAPGWRTHTQLPMGGATIVICGYKVTLLMEVRGIGVQQNSAEATFPTCLRLFVRAWDRKHYCDYVKIRLSKLSYLLTYLLTYLLKTVLYLSAVVSTAYWSYLYQQICIIMPLIIICLYLYDFIMNTCIVKRITY